ncbi:MAG: IclR family transcriptional regulator [Nevskia sp.]|jgi:DNA-binding IclR family transcriptional regulator|nr:IclR family transcriptional regulator [Nevskia sp.]MCK9385756.1 IclR family transcriptional regulator [Nevskia sp.]
MGSPKRAADTLGIEVDESHPQFVTALARGLAILRCFEHGAPQLGNQEIARRTGLPKPTVSRLTFTLASLGYLNYSASLEKYALGIRVLALGHAYMKGTDIVGLARPLMLELAEYAKGAVMIAGWASAQMILLDICQGDPDFHLKLEAGSRVPHGATALGRAYLAALPMEGFESALAGLEKDCAAASWPQVRDGIIRARKDYEQYGFCFSYGDWSPDVFAVGVPIIAADRSRILSLNCSGRISVTTRDKLIHDFGPRLVALRNRLFEMTGGRF